METSLWLHLCSYENLFHAYKRAKKHKTTKRYVQRFEKDLEGNLMLLRAELLLHSYRPKPLVSFIIRDPKSRRISRSDFRDRVVHHALCNMIEPLFERSFIYDSYANRIGKGVIAALTRFNAFKREVSRNNTIGCYVLKADIRHYFDEVDHAILMDCLRDRISDPDVLWLIQVILSNFSSSKAGKGMPLGNLTSQFFANVYLDRLDRYVKHCLRAEHYIRYVDDFVLMHSDRHTLSDWRYKIDDFLRSGLSLSLHCDKTKIIHLGDRFIFLGFRIYYHHRLPKRQNLLRFRKRLEIMAGEVHLYRQSYDLLYDSIEGWCAYAENSDSYHLRKSVLAWLEKEFPGRISSKELGRLS